MCARGVRKLVYIFGVPNTLVANFLGVGDGLGIVLCLGLWRDIPKDWLRGIF